MWQPSQQLQFNQQLQSQLESTNACTLRVGSSSVPVVAATAGLRRSKDLMTGGLLNEDEITFRVSKALLPVVPDVGTRIVWVEKTLVFRVQKFASTPGVDPAWHLVCGAPEK